MTMIGTEQMDEWPNREGRFIFNKKEILTAILTALEKWYISSKTPREKYVLVTGKSITKYVCYGTFNNSISFEDQDNFKKLKQRVGRWMNTFAEEKSGRNAWVFTPEALNNLRKEIGAAAPLTVGTKTEPEQEQEKDSMIINLSDFVKTVDAYQCVVCEEIYTKKLDLLLHFRKHKLSELMEESN